LIGPALHTSSQFYLLFAVQGLRPHLAPAAGAFMT
jgi:hypothetical protein